MLHALKAYYTLTLEIWGEVAAIAGIPLVSGKDDEVSKPPGPDCYGQAQDHHQYQELKQKVENITCGRKCECEVIGYMHNAMHMYATHTHTHK